MTFFPPKLYFLLSQLKNKYLFNSFFFSKIIL
uniref:Uncharacterized protein n=1 Tax=Anguilla anguilla TaxID=7936 RepID=A0A0E9P9E2_ANGAN